jgi:tuberous sclerosis protein 2
MYVPNDPILTCSQVFPALIPLCSYQSLLDTNRKRDLLRCLEFGLVSKHARQCVSALTVCALEMTEVMIRQLPSVLLRLSQISATTPMAVPVMEFLSTLVRIPRLYANFVEDQYLSIFAIALPYTNPFKFNHFAVSLAYTVIALWFIKCRQPFRKGFVSFITKGLKANIQQEMNNQNSEKSGSDCSARDRKGSAPGQELFLPLGQSSLKLHTELMESCLDLMARYTHSCFSLIPHRSPVAAFLLKGGQTQHWIVGTTIVSITTSSSGGKAMNNGLCDKVASTTRRMIFATFLKIFQVLILIIKNPHSYFT